MLFKHSSWTVCLRLCIAISQACWLLTAYPNLATDDEQAAWIRQVQGAADGYRGWVVQRHSNRVIVVDLGGNRDILHLLFGNYKPGEPRFKPPYPVLVIDPRTERVVERFESNHMWAVAVFAERGQSDNPWLAQRYNNWVIDDTRKVAYGLIPPERPMGYWHTVEKVDLRTRNVLHRVQFREVGAIALSPGGEKLYIGAMTDEGAHLAIHETETMRQVGMVPVPVRGYTCVERIIPTPDGKRVYCMNKAAFMILDTTKQEFLRDAITTFEGGSGCWAAETSEDGQEVYVAGGQATKEQPGYIFAIDATTGKQQRCLRIGVGMVTSLTVMGKKLFAACLDGIYVIDIDAWRKNPNYQPPWVKQEGK